MPVRDIRLFGDPVLRSKCVDLNIPDAANDALVADLIDTVKLPGRAGVAAPQIGVPVRAFSLNIDGQISYVLNPVLERTWGQLLEIGEGCLSVPDLWHDTPRYEFARVRGVDLSGKEVFLEGSGLLAQALQHECDHLDGLVYLNRLSGDSKKAAMAKLRNTAWFAR